MIGGSVAKAVKGNSDIRVTGWNRNPEVARTALRENVIDEIWDRESVLDAELIMIAAPPAATVEFLAANAPLFKKGAVITDVCGVKTGIVSECERICSFHGLLFIGGHPMAGKEKGGYDNSVATLFEGASYIVTPTSATLPAAMEMMKALAEVLKAGSLTVTTPEKHDQIIAFTSQLPHVLASAYVKSPLCAQRKGFSAGSFMDVSRVATADERLWTELFLQHAGNLCGEIDTLIKNLADYRDAIKNGSEQFLFNLIKQGREIKEKDCK